MARSIRTLLKEQFPKLHTTYAKSRKVLLTEYKVMRQIGIRSILRGDLWERSSWRDVLPMQTPQRIEIRDLIFSSINDLTSQLDAAGLAHADGGNAVYLPPATIDGSGFRVIRGYYPPNAGLKIVRDPGDVEQSQYISVESHSVINRKLTANHGHMTMAANLLHEQNLGPRVYDLVELSIGSQVWTAYAVAHVDGREPTMDECNSGIQRIQALVNTGVARVTVPGGYDHMDFTCPGCNGNALVGANGEFNYVDFQNIVLATYEKHLAELAKAASDDTHFGTESVLWGGRFLYQSIPGVKMHARRNVDQRFIVIDDMLAANGISLKGKLVLDIGCNIGMVIGEYLKRGAKWCHGWDMPTTVVHTEKLLLALGCTRFSVTGDQIKKHQDLEHEIPEFAQDDLNGCIISYLAIRGHIGWLDALARIKWSYLIYEEHQGDDFKADMDEFAQLVDFEILVARQYSDGLSNERHVAILKRKNQG